MYLKKSTNSKTGRTYLSAVHGYRDPKTKKSKTKTIKSFGYLDELKKEYEDPIEYFSKIVAKMDSERKKARTMEVIYNLDEEMTTETDDMKNIGFSVLSKIYHELRIHKFLINRERGLKAKHPLNNIMKLLIYSRILYPCSKFSTFENRKQFIENFDFPLESIYRSLRVFAKHKDPLLLDLHKNINMLYKRDTTNVFYDVTNYYFHKDDESELIKKGYGKDRKGKPIVQMGLLMDNDGIPMTYKLFKGNTTDFETLLPILSEVKKNFNLNRVIVVADKGLNSGTNKAYNIIKGDGYIFSRSLRGRKAGANDKNYALKQEDYRWISDEFKIKSRVIPTDITITEKNGKKKKVTIDEKHIVFYSEKYAKRSRYEREKIINKAKKMIANPKILVHAENYGAMKYIKGMKLDKKTGELKVSKNDTIPTLDEKLIKEDEKFDGYYSIVTNELDMPDEEVIERYRGLWKIEETFKISKSVINARPVWLSNDDSIEAHFLTCFLSLVILRILEKKTKNKYSVNKMIESLKKSNICLLEMNKYKAVYYDKVLEHIDKCVGTKLNRKYLLLDDIKKMISDTKFENNN